MKRRRLCSYKDDLAFQVLNAVGISAVDDMDLERLYVMMAKGNEKVDAYSEFCYPEADFRSVALCSLSAVMVRVILRLRRCPHLRGIIDPERLSLIDEEADRLYPSFSAICKDRGVVLQSHLHRWWELPSDSQREVAAADIHAWLSQPVSPLRSAVALFSGGGVFFAAQCHEKGARAAVVCHPIDCDEFEAAAVAHLGGVTSPPVRGRWGLRPRAPESRSLGRFE